MLKLIITNPLGAIGVLGIFAALMASAALYGAHYQHGQDVKSQKAAAADEMKRQNAANDTAKAAEQASVLTLNAEIDRLNKLAKDNADAAKNDPDAARCGVSLNGVRRLNLIK